MERKFDFTQQVKSISQRPAAYKALKKGGSTVAEMAEIAGVSVARVREWGYGGAIVIEDGLCSLAKKFKLMDVDPKETSPKKAKGKATSSQEKGSKKGEGKGSKKDGSKALKTAPRGPEKSEKKEAKKLGKVTKKA